MERYITEPLIHEYLAYLHSEEKSGATVEKYSRCLHRLRGILAGRPIEKAAVHAAKEALLATYAPATVNGAVAAWNGFFRWLGWYECCVRPVRVQRAMFLEKERELTQQEYLRLVSAAGAGSDRRIYYILQTLAATGIRISELTYITVEALHTGKARIHCKGKVRTILLPRKLCKLLQAYCRRRKIATGSVFVSRSGKPLDRSNIWRAMKALCRQAKVGQEKVFPHALRHLFARCFYAAEKDLDALAAVLGHSNINTTRIYTMATDLRHIQILERLPLTL